MRWLPHFTVDNDTCLWLGLRDKIFWDVNWVHGMYCYNNGQDRRMEMHYNIMINDYCHGQVNTHSFMSFPCSCNSQNLLPDEYIFPPLDAVCNDDWMFEVIHEIAVPNVMLDNGEMLDDGNAGPLVGPYDRVFVILVDSHTLYCGQTLPLTLAERVTYLAYCMNIVDALRRYSYIVSKGKVDGEILYTIDMPCDPCGAQTHEIWRTPVSVHRTYCTSQVCYHVKERSCVKESDHFSVYEINMHIFEQ